MHVGWEVQRRRGRWVRHRCRGCLRWAEWERDLQPTIVNDRGEATTVVIDDHDDLGLVRRTQAARQAPPIMFSDDSNLLAEPKPELVRAGIRGLGLTGLRTMTVPALRDLAKRAEIGVPRLARKETIVNTLFDAVRGI